MRAVFLDRDGVINKNPKEHDYVKFWEEFLFLPGAKETIKRLNEGGYRVIVVSNQAGINKGIISHKTVQEINGRMMEEVKKAGGKIEKVYYCPHRPDEKCNCRKPRPGLFLQAAKDYEIDFKRSYFIGDLASDIEAGHRVGLRVIFIPPKREKTNEKPDHIASNLSEAAALILKGS